MILYSLNFGIFFCENKLFCYCILFLAIVDFLFSFYKKKENVFNCFDPPSFS